MTQALMKNYNHFVSESDEYLNEWVAMVDGEVVAHGKHVKEVFDQASKKYPKKKLFIAKGHSDKAMIL